MKYRSPVPLTWFIEILRTVPLIWLIEISRSVPLIWLIEISFTSHIHLIYWNVVYNPFLSLTWLIVGKCWEVEGGNSLLENHLLVEPEDYYTHQTYKRTVNGIVSKFPFINWHLWVIKVASKGLFDLKWIRRTCTFLLKMDYFQLKILDGRKSPFKSHYGFIKVLTVHLKIRHANL